MNAPKLDQSGLTLLEMMIESSVTTVTLLALATLLAWTTNRFEIQMNQKEAEIDLMQAVFYTRYYLSQAVKTACLMGTLPAGDPAGTVLAVPAPALDYPPFGMVQGLVNCQDPSVWDPSPDTPNAVAVFMRETGSYAPSPTPPGGSATSQYQGTGIYWRPPNGTRSGYIYFSSTDPTGGSIGTQSVSFAIDHLVDFEVVPGTVQFEPAGPDPTVNPNGGTVTKPNVFRSITYKITARYFTNLLYPATLRKYDYPIPAGPAASYTDIDATVTVVARDNWLGFSPVANSSQRALGGIYFFKPQMPPLNSF